MLRDAVVFCVLWVCAPVVAWSADLPHPTYPLVHLAAGVPGFVGTALDSLGERSLQGVGLLQDVESACTLTASAVTTLLVGREDALQAVKTMFRGSLQAISLRLPSGAKHAITARDVWVDRGLLKAAAVKLQKVVAPIDADDSDEAALGRLQEALADPRILDNEKVLLALRQDLMNHRKSLGKNRSFLYLVVIVNSVEEVMGAEHAFLIEQFWQGEDRYRIYQSWLGQASLAHFLAKQYGEKTYLTAWEFSRFLAALDARYGRFDPKASEQSTFGYGTQKLMKELHPIVYDEADAVVGGLSFRYTVMGFDPAMVPGNFARIFGNKAVALRAERERVMKAEETQDAKEAQRGEAPQGGHGDTVKARSWASYLALPDWLPCRSRRARACDSASS